MKENVTLDEAIERSRAFAQLEDRDRRFVRQLVTTTLRRLGQIQNILRDYLADPLPPKNFNVKVLLMMGIAEHHFMRTPSHALVSEAVSLARSDETMRGYQGLTNAVLRKVCDREKDELPHLRYNLPRWIAKRWHAVYGDAWLSDLAAALTEAPATDLAIKPGSDLPIEAPDVLIEQEPKEPKASARAPVDQETADQTPGEQERVAEQAPEEKVSKASLSAQDGEVVSEGPDGERPRQEHEAPSVIKGSLLANGALRLAPAQGSIAQLPGYETGDWWVQDAAAQVPVLMLGDVAGKRVLDLCAAPGGKTLQLAARGAHVTAVDISENRLKRLHENLERCQLKAEVVTQDALTYSSDELFDAILLDAPCSATGTLRRHPELMWQRREESLLTNRRLQAKLLGRAARLLKPNGILVYAVCSLEPEEGIEQVMAALSALPLETSRLPSTPDWLSPLLTTEGFFRSAPQDWAEQGGMDGFFAARLQRREKDKPKAAVASTPRAGRLRLGSN